MPSITVIVPVYKVEAYLPRCMDSILAQTLTDFELILVDDGSPDNCPAICDAYAEKDSRIHVIHQKNGGLSAARNAGLDWMFAHSDSTWVSFIDSDDWIHPRYLEYLHRALIENQTCISVCTYERVEEDKAERFVWTDEPCGIAVYDATTQLSENGDLTVAWGRLYDREIFRTTRFPVGKIHEDTFIIPQILYEAERIAAVHAPAMYAYYQRSDSIVSTFSLKRLDGMEAYEQVCRYFKEKNRVLYRQYLCGSIHCGINRLKSLEQHPEYKRETKRFRKRYARALQEAVHEGLYSFEKDKWLYEIAYPRLMNLYWLVLAGKNKILRIFHG